MRQPVSEENAPPGIEESTATKRIRLIAAGFILIVVMFLLGLGGGYLRWGKNGTQDEIHLEELADLYEQVNPKEGYTLPVSYGDLGPRLVEAGVIDMDAFLAVMDEGGDGLDERQIEILKTGSVEPIVITSGNARFLLNFFWAVGLANKNPILSEGPMVQYSGGQIEGFASTGGWTLATKPVTNLYASLELIPLSTEQQTRVEQVTAAVYRPCCDNPTLFPDCNHGMAMLGLLELMASQDATTDQMFEAAKYINAFWFPQQNLETALHLRANRNVEFKDAEARLITSAEFSSGSGFAVLHQNLQAAGLLHQAPGQGGSCAN